MYCTYDEAGAALLIARGDPVATTKKASGKTTKSSSKTKSTEAAKKTARGRKASAAKKAGDNDAPTGEGPDGATTSVDRRAKRDRRESAGRRESADRRAQDVPVAKERRQVERRVKVSRRRQIDPTTCERDYTVDEIEFMSALDEYKRSSGRMFPTCSEVLEVLTKLGYRKRAEPEPSAEPGT